MVNYLLQGNLKTSWILVHYTFKEVLTKSNRTWSIASKIFLRTVLLIISVLHLLSKLHKIFLKYFMVIILNWNNVFDYTEIITWLTWWNRNSSILSMQRLFSISALSRFDIAIYLLYTISSGIGLLLVIIKNLTVFWRRQN